MHRNRSNKNTLQTAEQTTEEPEHISPKEIGTVIKTLKRKKSLGPDDIPNETFIEANKKTRDIFREAFNRIHVKEEIPESWQVGHILRLYKGKGTKGKCSSERGITLAKQPRKSIWKNHQRKSKERSPANRCPSRRHTRKCNLRPPYNPRPNHRRNQKW